MAYSDTNRAATCAEGATSGAACCACGATVLSPHLRVAGSPGREGFAPTTDRYGVALADIVRCSACGHMQLAAFPPTESLTESYAETESHDYLNEEAGQRATARSSLEALESHVPAGTLLDVGCWVGFLLDEASKRGWETRGVEPSHFASSHARDRFQLDVVTGGLEHLPEGAGPFDAVFLGDVLEHLVDPGATLARVHARLRPGGVVALALPDAGSRPARAMGRRWWSILPTHVQYFTRSSITRLLTGQGFEVVDLVTAPKTFSIAYYLGRVGGYSPRLAAALIRTAAALGLADRLWAPDFRDRMLVLARR